MTLLSCPTAFEIYNTLQLAQDPYGLLNSGELSPIRSVRNSLEADRSGFLTYVQEGKLIREVFRDPVIPATVLSDGIVDQTIMEVVMPSDVFVKEVFVFDALVSVWTSAGTMVFFPKSLQSGTVRDPMTQGNSTYSVNTNLTSLEFDSMRTLNEYIAYGISPNTLHRYTYDYNNNTQSITLIGESKITVTGLDGNNTRI